MLATGRVYGMTAGMGAPRLGAHLGGGIAGAIAEARRIGLGVDGAPGGPIQVWSQNPSGWRASVPKAKVVDDFRRGCVELDLWPVVTHGIYLMNFASPDDANWEKAIDALVVHLEVGAMIGAAAVVVHPGSGVTLGPDEAIARCALAMTKGLERTETLDAHPIVALETCAGAGKTIGKTFSELAAIVEGAGRHPGLGLCLDTAHLFGSGYDVATESGLAAYFYGRDIGRVWRVAEALEYGIVGINTGLISTEVAPFGGVKESGIGREGSQHGIEDFLEMKYLAWAGVKDEA